MSYVSAPTREENYVTERLLIHIRCTQICPRQTYKILITACLSFFFILPMPHSIIKSITNFWWQFKVCITLKLVPNTPEREKVNWHMSVGLWLGGIGTGWQTKGNRRYNVKPTMWSYSMIAWSYGEGVSALPLFWVSIRSKQPHKLKWNQLTREAKV